MASNITSRVKLIQIQCEMLVNQLKPDLTFTWIDRKNKIAFSLPPKCASTTLRLIQMAKVGFIFGAHIISIIKRIIVNV